jgi:hypothetical protein
MTGSAAAGFLHIGHGIDGSPRDGTRGALVQAQATQQRAERERVKQVKAFAKLCASVSFGLRLRSSAANSCNLSSAESAFASMSAAVCSRRREARRCHSATLHVLVWFAIMVLIASFNLDDLHQNYCAASYGKCDGKHVRMGRVTGVTPRRRRGSCCR